MNEIEIDLSNKLKDNQFIVPCSIVPKLLNNKIVIQYEIGTKQFELSKIANFQLKEGEIYKLISIPSDDGLDDLNDVWYFKYDGIISNDNPALLCKSCFSIGGKTRELDYSSFKPSILCYINEIKQIFLCDKSEISVYEQIEKNGAETIPVDWDLLIKHSAYPISYETTRS